MSFESTHEQGQSSGDQVEGLSEEQRQAYKEFTDYIGDRLNELLPPSLEAWSRDVSNLAVTLSEASPEDYANSSYVNDQIERAGISDEAKEVVLQVVNDYRDAIYEQGGSATTETPAEVFGMEERNANVGFDETKTYTLDDAYEAFQTEGMERLNNALEDIKNREFASSAEAAEAIMIALGEVASEVDRVSMGFSMGYQ